MSDYLLRYNYILFHVGNNIESQTISLKSKYQSYSFEITFELGNYVNEFGNQTN